MHEYEVLIETINPCGGEAHAAREFKQIEAASPEAYIAAQGRYPVLDSGKNSSGDTIITTGDATCALFISRLEREKAAKKAAKAAK